MPSFFVKYHEIDSTSLIVTRGKVQSGGLMYMRAVEAPDEATIRHNTHRLSHSKLPVEIDNITLMTVAQERVFIERLVL